MLWHTTGKKKQTANGSPILGCSFAVCFCGICLFSSGERRLRRRTAHIQKSVLRRGQARRSRARKIPLTSGVGTLAGAGHLIRPDLRRGNPRRSRAPDPPRKSGQRHRNVLLRRTEASPEIAPHSGVCAPMRTGSQEENPQITADLRRGNPRRRSALASAAQRRSTPVSRT